MLIGVTLSCRVLPRKLLLHVAPTTRILFDDYFDRDYGIGSFAHLVARHGRMAEVRRSIDIDEDQLRNTLEKMYAIPQLTITAAK